MLEANQNRFSIILPVRNGWPYIKTAVNSVLRQTYKNFELLILDNDSSDGTWEWCEGINDTRVKLFGSNEALNIEDSWSRILDIEKSEYMTMFAHDDILRPDFLCRINELIEKFPTANLYQTNGELVDYAGQVIRPCPEINEIETATDYLMARFSGTRDVFGTGYVMRSADYVTVGGIPKFNGLSFADDALWLMLLKDGVKVCSDTRAVQVRVHADSESATKPSNWRGFLSALRQFSEFLNEYSQSEMPNSELLDTGRKNFFANYLSNIFILGLVQFSIEGRRLSSEDYNFFSENYGYFLGVESSKVTWPLKVLLVLTLHRVLPSSLPLIWRTYNRFRSH